MRDISLYRSWPERVGMPASIQELSEVSSCRRSSSGDRCLFRNPAVPGLLGADQAPGPLLQRIRKLVEVVGRIAKIIDRVVDLVVVGSYNRLHGLQQALGFFQGCL